MVPFLTPSGTVASRPTEKTAATAHQHSHDTQTNTPEAQSTSQASAENANFQSQQNSLERRQIAALAAGAPYQGMPFAPMGYNVPQQPSQSQIFRNAVRNNLQGYSHQPGFYRGYMQSYNPGVNQDQQNVLNQRGRMD